MRSNLNSFLFTCDVPSLQLETIVTPNQQLYPWYHQRLRRVPTIDQCYTDDPCCEYEANQQFRRDKLVDGEILSILRNRFEDCVVYEAPDHVVKCSPILEVYKRAEENWFAKCKCFTACSADCRQSQFKIQFGNCRWWHGLPSRHKDGVLQTKASNGLGATSR